MLRIVAISTSFRPRSNSTILLEAALEGARARGADIEPVNLVDKTIRPCRACDACARSGRCVFVDDDFLPVMDSIWRAGRLLVATPVHYMAAPSQLKALIDRTQCLYNKKYVLRDRLDEQGLARRRGGVIAVAGSRVPDAFAGLELTMKYFFDSLQMTFAERLYVPRVDEPGAIARHQDRIAEARDLGMRLAGG